MCKHTAQEQKIQASAYHNAASPTYWYKAIYTSIFSFIGLPGSYEIPYNASFVFSSEIQRVENEKHGSLQFTLEK
jgi:hypothetical protein